MEGKSIMYHAQQQKAVLQGPDSATTASRTNTHHEKPQPSERAENESNENQVHIKINIIFEDPEATFYYLFPNFEGSGQCKQTYSVQHKKKVYFMKVSIVCSIHTHISLESKVGDPLKVVCSLLIYCPKRLLHTATSQEIN